MCEGTVVPYTSQGRRVNGYSCTHS